MKYYLITILIVLLAVSIYGKDIDAGEEVNWQALTSGGGMSSSGGLRLVSSFGQTAAGVTHSSSQSINIGFIQNFVASGDDCCIGMRGNVNCSASEDPDISDITRLVDFLYLTREELCCPLEADIDGSGRPFGIPGGDPDVTDVTRLIDYLYLSKTPITDCP